MDISKRFLDQIKSKEELTLSETALYFEKSERTILRWVNRQGLPRRRGRGTGMQGVYIKKELDEWYKENLYKFIKKI